MIWPPKQKQPTGYKEASNLSNASQLASGKASRLLNLSGRPTVSVVLLYCFEVNEKIHVECLSSVLGKAESMFSGNLILHFVFH